MRFHVVAPSVHLQRKCNGGAADFCAQARGSMGATLANLTSALRAPPRASFLRRHRTRPELKLHGLVRNTYGLKTRHLKDGPARARLAVEAGMPHTRQYLV